MREKYVFLLDSVTVFELFNAVSPIEDIHHCKLWFCVVKWEGFIVRRMQCWCISRSCFNTCWKPGCLSRNWTVSIITGPSMCIWDITLCSLIEVDRHFRGTFCLHHPYPDGWGSTHLWNIGLLLQDSTAQYPRKSSTLYVETRKLSYNIDDSVTAICISISATISWSTLSWSRHILGNQSNPAMSNRVWSWGWLKKRVDIKMQMLFLMISERFH
jgi:hypothetical protein